MVPFLSWSTDIIEICITQFCIKQVDRSYGNIQFITWATDYLDPEKETGGNSTKIQILIQGN